MYINKLFRGRYFQIEYIIEKKKYFIKDLWIGYGSFLKFDFPVTLKDNHLINIGESYLIANIINLDKEKNDINDDNIRLKIKVFKLQTMVETLYIILVIISYFTTEKKQIIIGRTSLCDIQVQDKLLSKIHCSINYINNCGWTITDGYNNSPSTNGSW